MRLVSLAEVPEQGLSHDPQIRKRVLLGSQEVPGLTSLAKAVFEPGQACCPHSHPSMVEVFLVDSGVGELMVNGSVYPLEKGSCVVVEAGELHALANTGDDDLVLTYFGLASQAG